MAALVGLRDEAEDPAALRDDPSVHRTVQDARHRARVEVHGVRDRSELRDTGEAVEVEVR